MEYSNTDAIRRALAALSAAERAELFAEIATQDAKTELDAVLAGRTPACPSCGAEDPFRWGHTQAGTPRFRCRGCKRTFNALTGTTAEGLHQREKWIPYLEGMATGETLTAAAARVGISLETSWRWRHRFAAGLIAEPGEPAQGVVEEDETFVRESEKGSWLRRLAKADPSAPKPSRPSHKRGTRASKPGISSEQRAIVSIRERGSRKARNAVLTHLAANDMAVALAAEVAKDATLIADGSTIAARAAALVDLAPISVPGGRRGAIPDHHIQPVNSYHSQLKGWLRRFRGVATRWLPKYVGWHAVVWTSGIALSGTEMLRIALAV